MRTRSGPAVTFGLRGGRPCPLLDAVEVEDVVAAVAAPHGGHEAHDVTAHHALVLLLGELLDQAPCRGRGRQHHHRHHQNHREPLTRSRRLTSSRTYRAEPSHDPTRTTDNVLTLLYKRLNQAINRETIDLITTRREPPTQIRQLCNS